MTRTRSVAATAAALTALAIAGCGGADESDPVASSSKPAAEQPAASAAPDTARPGAGVSAKLAASRENAGKVIDGDIEKTLASLKGVPVVVKQWASWCPQCEREFPYFQELADKYSDEVAFVGLNARDDRGAAEDYSAEADLKFPSIFDSDGSQSAAIGAGRSWPTTVIFDAQGNRAVVKPGAFASIDELDEYIRRFALTS